LLIALWVLFGLIFGSFGTVAAFRVPIRQSLWTPKRSYCPHCGETIGASENIPVISYVIQRGRCRHCKKPISFRYPFTEIVTGVVFGLSAWRFGWSPELIVYSGFFWALVVLSVIDLEHRLLPNRVVYPLFLIGWAGLAIIAFATGDPDRLFDAVLGMAMFGGFFFLIAFLFPAGMGGGDVKLAFVLGTFLGYTGDVGVVLFGMFLAFFLGGTVGVLIMAIKGGNRKTMVPFGPFLALGTAAALFWGDELIDLYLGLLS
jgi:leader peptidase (prepilin peptidase) / N-methyltransferase